MKAVNTEIDDHSLPGLGVTRMISSVRELWKHKFDEHSQARLDAPRMIQSEKL